MGETELGNADKVKVYGKGLEEGMANELNEFIVDTREAGKYSDEKTQTCWCLCKNDVDGIYFTFLFALLKVLNVAKPGLSCFSVPLNVDSLNILFPDKQISA